MQSYWMQMTETAAVLELRDSPMPQPGPGQLLVRMRAASLNRGEFVSGHGLHGAVGSWKAIGGEGAGVIEAIGPQVTGFSQGDRVMGRCAGAFSEFALMDVAEAMALPASLSFEEGAAILVGVGQPGRAGPTLREDKLGPAVPIDKRQPQPRLRLQRKRRERSRVTGSCRHGGPVPHR